MNGTASTVIEPSPVTLLIFSFVVFVVVAFLENHSTGSTHADPHRRFCFVFSFFSLEEKVGLKTAENDFQLPFVVVAVNRNEKVIIAHDLVVQDCYSIFFSFPSIFIFLFKLFEKTV